MYPKSLSLNQAAGGHKNTGNNGTGYAHGLAPGLELLRLAKTAGVQEITYYGFTTDNCGRPPEQVRAFS